ncbi:N-acetyltransferase [Leuconostoc litchii]|uniref:GNAT family N-acetyltransferase n=1 Tax=Leuconostoc litchii TaxID=1981069 RepID=A0A6P2CR23_9LACO|nr:GNAT family N-acetyltransferase [Leuconostoc litchii]TYC46709.1 GNAT family N-acetyltransferase [Leuconostoc litchii]GMA70587.1 N-acetyltransferase [Leuconostoc litchii]
MPLVYMRRARVEDASAIVEIIDNARKYLKLQGMSQWQAGYPNQDTIIEDLSLERGYLLLVDGQPAGYSAILTGEDPVYTLITDGQWLNSRTDYASIHRFAILDRYRGQKLAQRFMTGILTTFYEQGYRDFRIDTHPENMPMQAVIIGNGFEKRGVVHINEGDETNGIRWAYQVVL